MAMNIYIANCEIIKPGTHWNKVCLSSKLFYSSPAPCICGRKWCGWSCRAYKLPRDLDDSGSKPVFGYFDFWAPGVLMSVESFPLLLKFVVQSALYIWSNLKLSYCMQNSCRTCYLNYLRVREKEKILLSQLSFYNRVGFYRASLFSQDEGRTVCGFYCPGGRKHAGLPRKMKWDERCCAGLPCIVRCLKNDSKSRSRNSGSSLGFSRLHILLFIQNAKTAKQRKQPKYFEWFPLDLHFMTTLWQISRHRLTANALQLDPLQWKLKSG